MGAIQSRYRIRKFLGKGGIGEAFLAVDTHANDRLGVLKRVPANAFEKKIASLRREFEGLRQLCHPNITRVYDFGSDEDYVWFFEDYVDGSDIFQATHTANYNQVLSCFAQILRALHYLHQKDFLHGDLKAENIMVVKGAPLFQDDAVKLIDFGLMKHRRDIRPEGELSGSIHFMSPEMLQGKMYDQRADLYALGVCFYRILTGRLPFEHVGMENGKRRLDLLIEAQIRTVPVEPRHFRRDLPSGLNDLTMKLLRKLPEERQSSARDVLEALNVSEKENFFLRTRAERQEALDPSSLTKIRQQVFKLCAFAKMPLSEALLYRLFDRSPQELRSLLKSLEEEGWLQRSLLDGVYQYMSDPRKIQELSAKKVASLSADMLLNFLEETCRSGRQREARHCLEDFLGRSLRLSRGQKSRLWIAASLIYLETGDLVKAREACEKLMQFQYLTDVERGKILNRQGWIQYLQGNYRKALQVFDAAEACWKKGEGSEAILGQSAAANFQGMCWQALGDWKRAQESYRNALSILKEDDPLRPAVRMNLAIALQGGEAYAEAVYEYEQAVKESEGTTNHSLRARLLNNLANLYLFLGKLDRAGDCAHRSLKMAIEQGLAVVEGQDYLLLSVLSDRQGHPEECRQLLQKAAAILEEHGSVSERATVALHQAYDRLTCGDESATQGLVEKIRKDFASEGAILMQCDLLESKLIARRQPQDRTPGLLLLEKVLADCRKNHDKAHLWDVYFTMGEIYRREDPSRAQACFQKSMEALEELAQKIPQEYRNSFFRDRKREKILRELSSGEGATMEPIKQTGWVGMTLINRLLASEHHLAQLLETILDISIGLLEAERGFVLLLEKGQFRVTVSRNMDRQSLETSEKLHSTTIARRAASSGQTLLVTNAQADERFHEAESVIDLKLGAVLAVPLKAGTEVLGVIYVDNRMRIGCFDESRQKMLEAFADQASLALRNARQIEDIRRRESELEESKKQIESLNELLRQRLDVREHELAHVQKKYELQQSEIQLRYAYDRIIGRSAGIQEVLKTIDSVMDSDATVLLQGESGTGKELLAKALHYNGPRKQGPFVAENCSALSETLLESELFGHVKGSFTGAFQDREGLFAAADGGTIFLDEIGDMPLAMQAKLLRVLQERQIRPVGSKEYRKVNVRVVAATNRNLLKLVHEKKFREDLYYRINVIRVAVPPLRERVEDIPLLAEYFLKKYREETEQAVRLHPKARAALMAFDWPGNIRELSNEIQRACAMGAKVISPEVLSEKIQAQCHEARRTVSLDQHVVQAEKQRIVEALKKNNYSRNRTARDLDISRITLYKKMKAYGIAGLRC